MRTGYIELDEVKAPEDLPEAGVKAGDRGVVVAELHNPDADPPRAIKVEYADEDGVPKAFVVYSPDLKRLISVYQERYLD